MSWLNFNESLNSLKGQLSNLASGVLTEGVVNTENSGTSKEGDDVLDPTDRFTNIELQGSSNVLEQEPPDSWAWDSEKYSHTTDPNSRDEIIRNLQKKISILENEKRELTVSLEQLDFDCQQTTDKLVTLKDNLQVEYDELKTDFENLKKEYTVVLNENLAKSKEIQTAKSEQKNDELKKLKEENGILNKQLMISLKEVESKNELVDKYNELEKQCNNHLESLIAEKLINEELQKLYNNLEDVNTALNENLKKYSKLEPIELIKEYEEITLNATSLALEQNALIAENEELHSINSCLKNETAILKSDYDTSEINKLKDELEETQSLYTIQKDINNDLITKIELDAVNFQSLKQDSEKVVDQCKQLRTNVDNLNATIVLVTKERDDLDAVHKVLTQDHQQLKVNYEVLEKALDDSKAVAQNSDTQELQEKYVAVISDKVQGILNTNHTSSILYDEDPALFHFAEKIDTVLCEFVPFPEKYQVLEKQITDLTQQKNNVISEKNHEIEKLLHNSEILSQEVLSKSQSLKDMEDECAELMKNNDLLITELDNYRKSSNLQTISESNEDNLLLLEIQLENANKRIQELECIVIELESSKQDNLELELLKKHLNMTGQELNHSKEELSELLIRYNQLEEDKLLLKSTLDKTKSDYENIEYKYTELTVNYEASKEEIEHLKTKNSDIFDQYQHLTSLNTSLENKISFVQESEQALQQKLNNEVENNKDKEIQIQNFVERLQNSKVSETSWKLQVDTLHKELQTIVEAKQNLELTYELLLKDFEKQKEENKNAEKFLCTISNLEVQLQELTASRDELLNLVRSKHEENIRYHEEIQRLNLNLSGEIEKSRMLEKQFNELSMDSMSQEEIIQKDLEFDKIKDQNTFLKEKCEVLAQNLLQEQSNTQKVVQEYQAAIERETISSKELERLRLHLVEMEDTYTQELLLAEQKNKEMQLKVNEIEQREKDSNSIYTSVNIRANQQVETLHTQLQLVTNQRDEYRVTISEHEDKENKQVAALTNLQLVLEQFQRDKEKDVEQETERIRRQITVERRIQEELRNEIASLKMQLEESKQGLQAASRLSDQLEKSKQQAHNYKDEMLKLQGQLKSSESKCKELTGSSDMKVDKTLIKNLVLGYITSNSNDQRQILKVIAIVLDFNQKESEKANLNKLDQGGWLSAILHPQSLNPNQEGNQQSLSEAFVRFLENESKPKVVPNLLIATQQSKDNSNNGNQMQLPHTLQEVVLPTFDDFGSSRSSSSILKGVLKNNS